MTSFSRYFPWVGLFLATVYLIAAMIPPSDVNGGLKLQEAAEIPVNDGGRVKPLDTLARTDLMLISGRQSFTDPQANSAPAIQWALDVITSRRRNEQKWSADAAGKDDKAQPSEMQILLKNPTAKVQAFEIEYPGILADFNVQPRASKLYSFEELVGGMKRFHNNPATDDAVSSEVGRQTWERNNGREPNATEKKRAQINDLTPEGRARADLVHALNTYVRTVAYITPHKVFRIENLQVLSLLGLDPRSGYRYSFDEIVPRIGPLFLEAGRVRSIEDKNKSSYETHVAALAGHVNVYLDLANENNLRLVPPRVAGGEWLSVPAAVLAATPPEDEAADPDDPHASLRKKPSSAPIIENPEAMALAKMLMAYTYYDPDATPSDPANAKYIGLFNKGLDEYLELLERSPAREARGAPFETFFNHFAPFYQCTILYLVVLVVSISSWVARFFEPPLGLREPLARTAFWVMLLTLALHTWAIMGRMYLSGRPPVTNLYSSAVFIGWGSVVVAAVLEAIYHNGFSIPVGSVLGFTTTIIGHYLAQDGDTLKMMEAVLDTNFWLATHVTCVTSGYTATFVAGFLGMTYIGLGVLSRSLDKTTARTLYHMTYGVVCFAMMLSFIGTVLGGIWADQSWGRFWGWDPKENGALLIVIWNAIVLHARWGGMVKERGVAVLVVAGNIITGWSWFGTNFLGVGLHAYGFMNGAKEVLIAVDGVFLGFIGMGLLPLRFWRSFGGDWQIPGFRPPILPTGPLPSLGGIGAPPANPEAVTTSQEKPTKNKRGKNGRGIRR